MQADHDTYRTTMQADAQKMQAEHATYRTTMLAELQRLEALSKDKDQKLKDQKAEHAAEIRALTKKKKKKK
jgi:hypothetical protein